MRHVFPWREAPPAEFAVIGDPVSHSRSPAMHEAAFREAGMAHRYVALEVPIGEVVHALDRLRELAYVGVNVTVPHKEEVLTWCDGVEPFAREARAVNCVRIADRAGTNTDAPGFLDTLLELGLSPARALLLGAGGSGRALGLALVQAGWEVAVFNRTPSRAEELVSLLTRYGQAKAVEAARADGVSLILNTTSASLYGVEIPLDFAGAVDGAVAYDLMYGRSPFLGLAVQAGLRTLDGLPLLVAQGARSWDWWGLGSAPREVMLRAVSG